MKQINIMVGSRFTLTSYGNGLSYCLKDHCLLRSVFLSEEDARDFRDTLDAYEARWPHKNVDCILGTLWFDCEFDLIADEMSLVA